MSEPTLQQAIEKIRSKCLEVIALDRAGDGLENADRTTYEAACCIFSPASAKALLVFLDSNVPYVPKNSAALIEMAERLESK